MTNEGTEIGLAPKHKYYPYPVSSVQSYFTQLNRVILLVLSKEDWVMRAKM